MAKGLFNSQTVTLSCTSCGRESAHRIGGIKGDPNSVSCPSCGHSLREHAIAVLLAVKEGSKGIKLLKREVTRAKRKLK